MRKMKSMKVVLAALFGLSFSWNVCAQQSDIKDQGYVHKSSTSYEYLTDPAVLQKLDQWRDLKFGVLFHWDFIPYRVLSSRGCCVRKKNLFRAELKSSVICLMMILKNGIGD